MMEFIKQIRKICKYQDIYYENLVRKIGVLVSSVEISVRLQLIHDEAEAKMLRKRMELCDIYERGTKEYELNQYRLDLLEKRISATKQLLNHNNNEQQ